MLSGWQFVEIRELISQGVISRIQDGNHGNDHPKSSEYVNCGIPFIMARDLEGGRINTSSCAYLKRDRADGLRIGFAETGDILLSHKGTVGAVAEVQGGFDYVMLTPQVTYYRIGDPERLSREFLKQVFLGPEFQSRLATISAQSTRAYVGITEQKRLKIPLPPLPEQHRIAEILRTWDEAIEKLEVLRAVKERRLHILREKLTYADVHHEPVRLGDVTDEVTTRNGAGGLDRDKVMGVTNSRGIVPMREQTIAGDISRYKIVADQSFAYNPMRINVGSIARNQTGEDILVSPDYVAFACNPDGLLPDYLDHLRNTKWWAHYINSGGSGSVRQRTYYGDLAAMKVPLPAAIEQQRIADALNTAQRDAEATAREIAALQRQKHGLMQKLLTGEWRVPTEQAAEVTE